MTICNGKCKEYKAKRSWKKKNGRLVNFGYYALGYKKCSHCGLFLDFEGRFCPCCHVQLKTRPSDRLLKQRLLEAHVSNIK